jgi:hypothetical protein
MRPENPFPELALGELFDTLLPDFVLAFTFFTALTYAVLGKRFDHQRSAAAMAAAMGLALATGLVWWEKGQDWSIRDLGPLAVAFALVVLGITLYHAIRQTGGALAGTTIALGICVLMTLILGMDVPVRGETIEAVVIVALVVGAIAFLVHHLAKGRPMMLPVAPTRTEIVQIRQDLSDVRRDRQVNADINQAMRRTRQEAEVAAIRPEYAQDVLAQLRRMLPAEGWLTERLARLRAKAHHVRKGHLARLDETKALVAKLPDSAKKQAATALAEKYRDLLDVDARLERLDKAVAENERRIRQITQEAEKAAEKYDFRKLVNLIESADKLQGHNEELFKLIDRTEQRLSEAAEAVAQQYREVTSV